MMQSNFLAAVDLGFAVLDNCSDLQQFILFRENSPYLSRQHMHIYRVQILISKRSPCNILADLITLQYHILAASNIS